MESFGIFTVYKTGTKRRKVNKIDFYKFIWVFWEKMNIFFWGYFSSSRYEETKKKKKKIMDSDPVFEHEQNGICGILESYSSFCTRERVVVKF